VRNGGGGAQLQNPPARDLLCARRRALCPGALGCPVAHVLPSTDLLALAITADLVLGLPLLFGLLVARHLRLPWTTCIPVAVLGAVVAYRLLPPTHRAPLDLPARLLPLVELALLTYTAVRLRGILQRYHAHRPEAIYASDALAAAVRDRFGRLPLVSTLVAELSLVTLAAGSCATGPRARTCMSFRCTGAACTRPSYGCSVCCWSPRRSPYTSSWRDFGAQPPPGF
jgi:hypothetical protein